LLAGLVTILAQDISMKFGSEPRFTFDDVHFGPGNEAAPVDDAVFAQAADLLEGKGLSIPDSRSRIQDAYGDDVSLRARNTMEL
jgi:hypothetical protein